MRYSSFCLVTVLFLFGGKWGLAQSSVPIWEGRDIIVSKGEVLVGKRESFRDGRATFARRIHFHSDTLVSGEVISTTYESLHLEIQTDQPFGLRTVVDSLQTSPRENGYEMIFYRGRFADPGFKRELGRVHLPPEAVKTVANGEEIQTYYHSIDLVKVPLLLLNDHRLDRIDIHRIEYVSEQ